VGIWRARGHVVASMASRIAEKMAGDILKTGKIKVPSGWLWQTTGSTLGSPETGFGKREVTKWREVGTAELLPIVFLV